MEASFPVVPTKSISELTNEELAQARRNSESDRRKNELAESPLIRCTTHLVSLIDEGKKEHPLSAFYPTESGQAQAAERYFHGEGIKSTPARGIMVYDPAWGYFRSDVAEDAAYNALDYLGRLRSDLRDVNGDRKQAEKFARDAQTSRSLAATLSLLRRRPTVRSLDSEFNRDPALLNCQGYAVPLREGIPGIRKSNPGDMFTMSTGFCPEIGATPCFDQFMKQITLDRPDLTAYMLRFFGLSLTGDQAAEIFENLWGNGRNGKGALLRLIKKILGSYAITISPSVVIDEGRSVGGPHPELCDLDGPRLFVADEIPAGRLNLENVKRLTGGGDSIRAARKFKDDYEFIPCGKLVIASNARLSVPRVDVALLRRYRLIPFEYTVPAGEEDHSIENRLEKEAPRILARLIEEAGEYYAAGGGPRAFPYSPTIEAASLSYLADEDILGRFIGERCIPIGSARASELYKAFAAWAEGEGIKPMGARSFGEGLVSKGHERKHTNAGSVYLGLSLKGEN